MEKLVDLNKKKLKVGVIGAGKMSSKTHLPIISRLQEDKIYDLSVICDLNIEAAKVAANKFGFDNYIHEANEVFNYSLDVLYVFGTTHLHYEFAKKALNKNINVFIEKPPAPDLGHFQELVEIEKKSSAVGVVGLNRRFQKNIEEIKESLDGLGLYAMDAVFHKPVVDQEPPHGARTWFPINAIHSLDVLIYVKGSSPRFIYTATNSVNSEIAQNFSVLLKWNDGTHAVLSSDYSAGARMERYSFHGYDTSYEVNLSNHPTFTKSKGGESETVKEDHTIRYRGFDGEHEEFAQAILKNTKPRHSFDTCVDTMHITGLIEDGFSGEVPKIISESIEESGSNSENIKETILILNPNGIKQFLPKLKEEKDLIFVEELKNTPEYRLNNIKALITGPGGDPITEEMINMVPSLEVVGIIGASLKSYNTDILMDNNVQILNASDAFAESVAEFIIMQSIAGVREATRSHDIMRAGGWGLSHTAKMGISKKLRKLVNKSALSPLKKMLKPLWKKASKAGIVKSTVSTRPSLENDFRGSSYGIVGFGEITKKLIPYLHAFGCEVKVCSDYLSAEKAEKYKVKKSTLNEVLHCDVVALLRGFSSRTKDSFGKEEFTAMKKGAVFVNASRAGIINEKDMMEALKENTFFACLDVFHREPLEKSSALRSLPNVFLTSHIAACSAQMRLDSVETVIKKVSNYLDGNEVEDVIVDSDLLQNMT